MKPRGLKDIFRRGEYYVYNDGMQCNIDAKGKSVRLIGGMISLLIGLILGGLAFAHVVDGQWVWPVVIATLLSGAFQIFEARAGWCVLRAMGFKTPV